MNSDKPFIEITSLSKEYRSRRHTVTALSSIDIQVAKAEFVLLKGRSGAGKSTLLSIIGGLIRPTTGTVRIDDNIITSLDNKTRSRMLSEKIGMIFQGFNLIPAYNIYENIEVALSPKGLSAGEIKRLAMPLFEKFGLTDKLNMLPDELSIGQQQKVAVIRTLVKKPALILADEPTASVDDETAGEILNVLRNLKEEGKVTVILATHGLVSDSLGNRIIFLENGSIKN